MRKINKLLFVLSMGLLMFGCSKASDKTKVTTNKTTTSSSTSRTTKRTTAQPTTTAEDVFDVLVTKTIDDAATIRGTGIFNLNSSTTIRITVNYGYEYVGLYNGETLLTEETEYEITDIQESLLLTAKFNPINYNVNVVKDIEEAATITGIGDIPYKSSTTINIDLDPEFLLIGLYDQDDNLLTDKTEYVIESVTNDLTLTAKFKQKTYDVVVEQSLKNAAVITGTGSFIKGSNTTLNIETNPGYNYLGLYDGETLLTEDATYEVTNVTAPITFTALFSANSYNVLTVLDDATLGTIKMIDDTYDCGTEIELVATPILGYRVKGWYVNGEYLDDKDTVTFIVPAYDCEITVDFTIKTFTVTFTDNIDGLGEFYVDGYYYDKDEEYSFEYGSDIYYYISDVFGYDFDYAIVNGEQTDDCSADIYNMDTNYTIEVFYKPADMYFYMMYNKDRLSISGGIMIDVLPDEFEYGIIDNDDSDYKGYSYICGYYKYKSVINITLKVQTDYYLDSLTNLSTNNSVGSIENDVITLTIDCDCSNLLISVLGRICHITVEAQNPISGTVTGSGDYHYGDYAQLSATPNKGYKFTKWVDEEGNEYGKVYWIVHDYVDDDPLVPLFGDAIYIAVFEPDEFDCNIHLVARNASRNVDYYVLTYLTEYDIHAPNVSGYTFAGWLENEDIDSLFSTDEVLHYTMINEESTIYAYYTPNSYTVTFDLDGGSCSTTSQVLTVGDTFTTEVPTKENLTFMGYNYYHVEEEHICQSESTTLTYCIAGIFRILPADAETMIKRGVVLVNGEVVTDSDYYVYRGDVVTIVDYLTGVKTVNSDGTSNGAYGYGFDAIFKALWGAKVTIKYNNGNDDEVNVYALGQYIGYHGPAEGKTGYSFKGWYVGDEEFDFYQPLYQNVVVEAKWEPIIYTVTLTQSDSRYGEIVNPITSAKYGDTITLTFNTFDNYTFEYWRNLDTDEKFTDSTITFTMPAQNIRFKAIVSAYIMYIFTNDDAMGTVEEDSIIARPGSEVSVAAYPNDGYGFEGWKLNGEIISTDPITTITMPKNAMTMVTAVFGKLVTDKYERLGNKVWFGYYPQTCLNPNGQSGSNSALIDELENIAGGFPTLDTKAHYEETKDNTNWINYDYEIYPNEKDWYKAEQKINYETYQPYWEYTYYKAPHMWYIDIDYDGDGKYDYRGLLIYSYRNDEINKEKSSTNTDSTHQDDYHFGRSVAYATYWFKYELIEWDVLENNDGTVKLIANLAIDSQNFSLSSNSYASSYIRDFLNDDFYNTAFNDLEKSIMNTMTIGSNNDFVTILTQEEATSYFENNADRTTQPTDYAMSQNCYVYSSPNIYNPTNDGNCYWLTRSAYTESGKIYYINYTGTVANGKTNMTYYGIRPVITVTL